MKKNFFYAILATVVMICFASCEKDFEEPTKPEPIDPTKDVVINSNVIASGVDNNIAEETTTVSEEKGLNVTTLKYKSWIRVKGQTRADFDEEVAVDLNDRFADVDTAVYVDDLELGDYTTSISYEARGSRKEGFVTIIDSVLVYTVKYANFSFRYDLDYEVAIYDDGVTRQVMPYHPIQSVYDAGIGVTRLPNSDDGYKTYASKKILHAIYVKCNGKDYKVTANVKVTKWTGYTGSPYVVESQVLDKILGCDGRIITSIIVRRTWSTGETEDAVVSVPLNAGVYDSTVGGPDERYWRNEPYVVKDLNDISILSSYLEDDRIDQHRSEIKFVTIRTVHQNWVVEYSHGIVSKLPLYYDTAYYDDGYTHHEYDAYTFRNITNGNPWKMKLYGDSDADGVYDIYDLYQPVSFDIGDFHYNTNGAIQVKVYQ